MKLGRVSKVTQLEKYLALDLGSDVSDSIDNPDCLLVLRAKAASIKFHRRLQSKIRMQIEYRACESN